MGHRLIIILSSTMGYRLIIILGSTMEHRLIIILGSTMGHRLIIILGSTMEHRLIIILGSTMGHRLIIILGSTMGHRLIIILGSIMGYKLIIILGSTMGLRLIIKAYILQHGRNRTTMDLLVICWNFLIGKCVRVCVYTNSSQNSYLVYCYKQKSDSLTRNHLGTPNRHQKHFYEDIVANNEQLTTYFN